MKPPITFYHERYVQTRLVHGQATEVGDYRRGNRAYDQHIRALAKIRETPDHGLEFLLGLLDHASPWVRVAAAVDLLFMEPEKASRLLEGMTNAQFVPWQLRASCKVVLQEWRAGRFKPRA